MSSPQRPNPEPEDAAARPGPLALIVEDNPANLLLARAALERGGYRTAEARSAEEALTWLETGAPDVILMDVQLPGMDGLTLTRRLKADPATRAIPVVALTAGAMPDDEARVREAGCDGYLTKPIRVASFAETLDALLRRTGARGARSPAESTPASMATGVRQDAPETDDTLAAAPGAGIAKRRSGASVLVVDDHPEGIELVRAYLAQEGYEVRAALTGGEALESAVGDPPDLILLDVMLPDMDGYEVCRRLRAAEQTRAVPVVMLTALRDASDRIQGLEAGADDFLSKPVDHAELRARVRALLRAKALNDELIAQRRDLERHEEALKRANDALEAKVAERTADLRHAVVRLREELASREAAEAEVLAVNERLSQALAELEAAQQRVVQQERLRALGEMASGIAHDFNNALAPVVGFADLLLETPGALSDEAKVRSHVEMIRDGAHDAASVVRRLREFYRPRAEGEELAPVDLLEVVEKAVALTRPKWKGQAQALGRTIEAEVRSDPVPEVMADEAELRELLTNLIFNAVDAMPEGGTLGIRVRSEGGRVLLEVSDTGVGMSDEVRRKCLEPFFTTKGEQGTGLGLAMAYGIVRRHGGTLQIDSEPGKGTTFRINLPPAGDWVGPAHANAVEDVAEGVPEGASGDAHLPGSLRVLLADDEVAVQAVVTAYLEALGHRVERVANGAEALAKLGEAQFDLVVTDHAMPGMSGSEVAAAVKRLSPETPVVLLTGFGNLMGKGDKPEGVDEVLGKPASLSALRETIARATSRVAPRD